jgi:hypothetical protein
VEAGKIGSPYKYRNEEDASSLSVEEDEKVAD